MMTIKAIGFALSLLCFVLICPGAAGAAVPAAQCEDHLKMIHQAIQQHRRDHKDLPSRLSDLVPAYFADRNILYCPNPIRSGTSAMAVGKKTDDLNTSYFYEFSLLPTSTPGKTERDRKRAQMGLLGSEVPIVRCLLHERYLNLSFGGEIYQSGLEWENNYTNLVHRSDLFMTRLFRNTAVRVVPIQPRPASADPSQIDLSDFYNASLAKAWLSDPSQHLAPLASENEPLQPVAFDARGVIQVAGETIGFVSFPDEIKGVTIDRTCRNLHFLHGSAGAATPGNQIGKYIVHFQDGGLHEIPIVYGHHLLNSWDAPENAIVPHAQLAWEKPITENGATKHTRRLYRLTWENNRPNVRILSVDLISQKSSAAPFLVAITAEE